MILSTTTLARLLAGTTLVLCAHAYAGPPGTPYSIGSPTAKEQLHVELINRARANPTAEGIRLAALATSDAQIAAAYTYFKVSLSALQAEFVTGSASGKPTLQVAAPLSISAKLTTAARLHAQDQITWDYQGHTSHNGSTLSARLAAQGYSFSNGGENVYSSSAYPLYGHAGFNVDWGGNDGTGMQGPPRGHRSGIHSANFREIGVGNLTAAETVIPAGNVTAKGPEVLVEDFATASGATPFITGVVYYDFNGNSFYDPGEGIGGVEVGATGSSWKGVTAASGGYSIPVPGNGSYPLEFWFPGATAAGHSTIATVTGGLNVKSDWTPAFGTPSLSGPAGPVAGVANAYTSLAHGGAASYQLHAAVLISAPVPETADSGPAGYSLVPGTSGSLAVEVGGYAGYGFHFGHSGISSPTLTLNRQFLPGAAASLSFRSRLRYATANELASVQARRAGGSWTTVWSQAGSGGVGEASYALRTCSLAAFAGLPTEIRFVFSYASGSYYPVNSSAGWFLDDLSLTASGELSGQTVTSFASPALAFTPPATGAYRLWVQPQLADPLYQSAPTSAMLTVTASASGYLAWRTTAFPAVTGSPTADHDSDGIANGIEYAFGLNPTAATPASGLPPLVLTADTADFDYLVPAGVQGVTYAAEWSEDFLTWTSVGNSGSTGHPVFSVPRAGKQRLFLRHRIVVTP